MTPKKFARGVVYVIAAALLALFVYNIVEFTVRNWDAMWPITMGILVAAAISGLFALVLWAFDDDEPKPAPRSIFDRPDITLGYDHINTMQDHYPTKEPAGDGIRGLCSCGEPIDNYLEHVHDMYKESKK